MKKMLKKITYALMLSLLFTACGGGGNGGGTEPTEKELAIAKITAYTTDGTSAPTLQDYIDAGVSNLDATNLENINEVVENLSREAVDTTAELQALVDAQGVTIDTKAPVITHNGTTYGFVTSPRTGKVWLDRNLGAARVCESYNDKACYGDYYQWGRNFDGHQDITSVRTATQATDVNTVGSDFITGNSHDWAKIADSDGSLRSANWSKTDGSSVCPTGYRVPTLAELRAETLDNGVTNRATAYSSFLKLPSAGYRGDYAGTFFAQGTFGRVWASSVDGSYSHCIYFSSRLASSQNCRRAYGVTVRCLRD